MPGVVLRSLALVYLKPGRSASEDGHPQDKAGWSCPWLPPPRFRRMAALVRRYLAHIQERSAI